MRSGLLFHDRGQPGMGVRAVLGFWIVTGKPVLVWTISGFDPVPPNSGSVLSATYSRTGDLVLDTVFCLRQWETLEISGIPGLSGRLRILELDSAAKTVVVCILRHRRIDRHLVARCAPHRTTGMARRLYRTVTTSAGTDYYFVKEFWLRRALRG